MILLCVRWYLRYCLSYRDLAEMMAERGLNLDHTTIYCWVQKYAPELKKRCNPYLQQTNDSWRVDETYIVDNLSNRLTSMLRTINLPVNQLCM